jgi:uncharacterized protein YbjT (DUF2867 family)
MALLGIAFLWSPTVESRADSLASYHQALDVVEQSLSAHGGIEVIQSADGFQVVMQGTFDLATRLQGRSAFRSEPTPITERINYDAANDRVSYDVNWFNYYSSNQDLREIHDDQGRVLFIDKVNRNGGWLPLGTVADHRERFTRVLPQMMLAEALRQRHSLRWTGQRHVADRLVDCVDYTTTAGDTVSVCIDSGTRLVASASALLEMPLLGDTRMTWQWSGYDNLNADVIVPSRLVVRLGDDAMKDVSLVTTLGVDKDAFGPPDGIEVAEPPDNTPSLAEFVPYGERTPEIQTIAPQVYMVNNLRPGFRLLFVEFDEYVVAVDAPTGWYEMNQVPPMNWSHGDSIAALGHKYLKAINETVPGKPVRYVVLTHHHSDHIGGLKPFVEAGATILAGEGAAHMAELAVSAQATLSADRLTNSESTSPSIEVVKGDRTIADTSMAMRLIELPDGNPKADNYLMVYLPNQKLLYSTAFIYPLPESVFPPRETIPLSKYFVSWLDASGLDVELIYNVHGMGRVEDWHLQTIRDLANGAEAPLTETRAARPTILVTGATGRQGGAVARDLVSRGFKVRAMTRSPQSAKASSLRELGIVVVAGDFDDTESLDRAMDGAFGVFGMTDFWEHGYEREVQHGKNLIEAALRTGVQHFVYTSVASANHDTDIPHFESKRHVELLLESSGLDYTVIRPVSFMENWSLDDEEILAGEILTAGNPDKPHQHISVQDIGRFVGEIYDSPGEWNGRSIDVAGDALSLREMTRLLSTVTGRKIGTRTISWDDYEARFGAESAIMSRWFDEDGYRVDLAALRRAYPDLMTFEQYFRKQHEAAMAN